MSAAPQAKRTPLETLWFAVRFVVFGVGGFLAVWISWLSLLFAFDPPPERWLNPVAALSLGLIGALMMLYGGGQWGRWAYVWVFLSTPITVSLVLLGSKLLARWFPNGGSDPDFIDPKLLGILLFAAPMPVSYFLVKRHYAKKDACPTQ